MSTLSRLPRDVLREAVPPPESLDAFYRTVPRITQLGHDARYSRLSFFPEETYPSESRARPRTIPEFAAEADDIVHDLRMLTQSAKTAVYSWQHVIDSYDATRDDVESAYNVLSHALSQLLAFFRFILPFHRAYAVVTPVTAALDHHMQYYRDLEASQRLDQVAKWESDVRFVARALIDILRDARQYATVRRASGALGKFSRHS